MKDKKKVKTLYQCVQERRQDIFLPFAGGLVRRVTGISRAGQGRLLLLHVLGRGGGGLALLGPAGIRLVPKARHFVLRQAHQLWKQLGVNAKKLAHGQMKKVNILPLEQGCRK